MKRTAASLAEMKRLGRKIAALTCYDHPTALIEQEAGIDIVLVGDSVGTNVLGYASEREVTLADMAHHVRAVRRGTVDAYLLADLPYATYDTPDAALASARVLVDAGADAVKLEGPCVDIIAHLHRHGIAVSGHLGFEPQHHGKAGVKAKSVEEAQHLADNATAVAAAGAVLLVLELVPAEVGSFVTRRVPIPTIGIGAGAGTDGQVLVVTDLLGYGAREFRHNRRYQEFGRLARAAVEAYRRDVAEGRFPTDGNAARLSPAEASSLLDE